MIDIGFFEISLVAVVALLILGPKRLPRVAQTVGRLLGKSRKLWRKVKNEVADLDSDPDPDSDSDAKSSKRDSHE